MYMSGSKNHQGVGGPDNVLVINVFHRGPYRPPRNAIEPDGFNCIPMGSVPVLLRKPTGTCDFPGTGGGGGWVRIPAHPARLWIRP